MSDSLPHDDIAGLLELIEAPDVSIRQLRTLWEERNVSLWQEFPEIYLVLARRLRHQSHPFLAFEIATEGLTLDRHSPAAAELTQIAALSLARTGATVSALDLLNELMAEGHEDAETLSLVGRICKQKADAASSPDARDQALEQALDYYEKAAGKEPDNYYPLINTAAVSLFLGRRKDAESRASEVIRLCDPQRSSDESYWLQATLGEAHLILGNLDEARNFYRAASEAACRDAASLQTMRSQAVRILTAAEIDPAFLNDAFCAPDILVFSGFRTDSPDRDPSRFPEKNTELVLQSLREEISMFNSPIAYSSAAPGSDLLFAQAILERGSELHLVLPFEPEIFRQYISETADERWLDIFDRVLSQSTEVTMASWGTFDEDIQGPAIYDFVNRLILGLAKIQSRFLDAPVRTIAVWDGETAERLTGGTSDCIALWLESGLRLDLWIRPDGSRCHLPEVTFNSNRPEESPEDQKIRAVLFSDVVGFSKIQDFDLPEYYEIFLGQVALTWGRLNFKPLTSNNWGDAYYFVFENIRQAGKFAIEFRDAIESLEWKPRSASDRLRFRIALNAGPVFEREEPVTGLINFSGQHTSRAARIEPIVQEGQIFCSDYFAALAAAEGVTEFTCDYIGERQLAKKFGSSRVFILRDAR